MLETQTAPAPRENDRFVGHGLAVRAIGDALGGGRLHHAWLITGPEGVGKATLAYRFARALLAGKGALLDMAPDNPVFRRVAAGTHADLLTVEREWDEKKKRMKKAIAAETARGIPPFLRLTPAEGGWRVVVVDGAEDLNPQSANALLKVLEEPPPRAVLILVCSAAGRLLPTIRSRCRLLTLGPLGEAEMAEALTVYLPELNVTDRATLARLADGSPGRALTLAEEGGIRLAGMVQEVLEAGSGFAMPRAYAIADALREQAPFETFMGLLSRFISAAVTSAIRGTADPLQARIAGARPPAAWGEVVQQLTRLLDETERFNLDRRQAVVAGLALVRGA